MKIIAHRINTFEDLLNLKINTPIEFDVRDSAGKCIVTHDPFTNGILFEDFIRKIENRFCIVNIKSEGIEPFILSLLEKHNITNFFLLDCSMPMIYKLASQGERRIAIRYSEKETIESVLKWKNLVNWIWVDCFTEFPLTKDIEVLMHTNDFKICIVSPELHGRMSDTDTYISIIKNNNINIDAVCTKSYNIEKWQTLVLN